MGTFVWAVCLGVALGQTERDVAVARHWGRPDPTGRSWPPARARRGRHRANRWAGCGWLVVGVLVLAVVVAVLVAGWAAGPDQPAPVSRPGGSSRG